MATFDEFYRSLPEDRNKRGEFFEKVFIPWFLKTDPEWSTKVKQIWLWDEYPGRWGRDCGIDLVYEDRQGNHWAVQSKCVAPDREISKAEIDSFLSESNDSRIYGRLLITSTDGIGKNALQVLERQEKQIVCFLREHFQQSEIEFPSSPDDLASGRRKDKREPRPHQEEAIKNVVAGFKGADRGQLLMACGTGKTLTSLWIKEALNANRTLVLLPSLSLLSQTLREWTATSREEFNWICVCSDKSVVKQDKTVDDWIENVSGLGVPVTSDSEEIRQFLQGNEGGVIFSTYQSSVLIAEAQQNTDVPAFDVAFADEAHRCAGKVSEAFGSILNKKKIRANKRLFMTATPRVLSSQIKTRADSENIEVASMDDESLFGKVLHRLNFSEAISKELLTDYRVVVIGVDDPEVQAQIIHRPLSATSNGVETDYESLANHISLAKAIRDYDLQRIITFHGRVKGAKKFSEDHPSIVDWLPTSSKTETAIQTGYVSGEMTSLERNKKIGQLRNLKDSQIGILSNARCLSEGVDVPSLDGIAFIDPRSSQVDIIQAVGRAIRKSKEKSFGYIILPVYLGNTENIDEQLLASRFKDIWKVILALKSQDDTLSEVLDRLRVERGKRGESKSRNEGLTKIIFDLPQRVMNTLGNSLQTILIRNTTDNWNEMYGKLQEYARVKCHARAKRSDSNLGNWVIIQRSQYKRGDLSTERFRLLEQLPGWTWDPFETDWIKNYQELKEYAQINGHAQPSKNHPVLGTWAQTQRANYKKGMPSNRIVLLEEFPGWVWDQEEADWMENYQEIQEYAKINGDARVPQRTPILGNWVVNQRTLYRGGGLHRKRILLLEELPRWAWDPKETDWMENYQELQEYTKINGHARVNQKTPNLGSWVQIQRTFYKKDMPSERIALLEELPGWVWDPREADWIEKYRKFKEHIMLNPHLPVRRREPIFGNWIAGQRQLYRKGKLPHEKVSLLEELRGWTWHKDR